MFESLRLLYSENLIRAIFATVGMVAIFGLLLWVSIIDVKKMSVTFWKMLVAGFSTIFFPIITSLFCGCWKLPVYLAAAIPLWFFLLYINIKFNLDRFIGKADIDLLSAILAEMIMYSIWMFRTLESTIAAAQVMHFWYSGFLYLLLGSIAFVVIVSIIILIKFIKSGKKSFMKNVKDTRVSVIPMLMPVCLIIPYIIMTY